MRFSEIVESEKIRTRRPEPLNAEPSAFLAKWAPTPEPGALPVLDVACGFGRNTLFLASLGHRVICTDRDAVRLDAFASSAAGLTALRDGQVYAICADLDGLQLPFRRKSFSLVVLVHFVPRHLDPIAALVAPGGMLIIETFGGHGGNWALLPRRGEFRERLQFQFMFQVYKERPVGPAWRQAVALRACARCGERD